MYEFVGAFCLSRELAEKIQRNWPTVEMSSVDSPFAGMGIRFADEIPRDEVNEASFCSFRDSLAGISSEFGDEPLVYVEAECWGGTCEYRGLVFVNGELKAECEGGAALRDLMRTLGAELDEREYFAPFERSFPWGSAK